jgi:hypothetical protein
MRRAAVAQVGVVGDRTGTDDSSDRTDDGRDQVGRCMRFSSFDETVVAMAGEAIHSPVGKLEQSVSES